MQQRNMAQRHSVLSSIVSEREKEASAE